MLIEGSNFIPDLKESIRVTLQTVCELLRQAGLAVNLPKTHLIVCSIKFRPVPLSVDFEGSLISSTSEFKYLRVILDDRLEWKPHLQYIYNKACKLLPRLVVVTLVTPIVHGA